jgi:hypothetical protein
MLEFFCYLETITMAYETELEQINGMMMKVDHKQSPHPDMPGATIAVANKQKHRLDYYRQHPGVSQTLEIGGGPEPTSTSVAEIALAKAFFALAHLTPENEVHFFISQDTQNNKQARPKGEEDILRTLYDLPNSYDAETATVFVNGHAQLYTQTLEIGLDPQRQQQLQKDPHYFDEYLAATREYAQVEATNVAGGLCLEGLLVIGAIRELNKRHLNDYSAQQQIALIHHGLRTVVAGLPKHFDALLPRRATRANHPQVEAFHLQAARLQKKASHKIH